MNLAAKYRPNDWENVCAQKTIIRIMENQIKLKQFPNCILLTGGSGIGKTSLARIYANKINNYCGEPLEIDAASNNGVDNIRAIINSAKERSLESEYKIFIIDEAHMLTTAAWNAFLKCLEEPPKYTIFIFCTTDPQKIPTTIQSRMMRFNLTPIEPTYIEQRLNYICEQENFTNYKESTNYISKIVDGGMRKAISYLEKVSNLSTNISLENTLKVLGDYSYDIMFNLTNSIIDCDEIKLISIIDNLYFKGEDLKLFLNQYIDFILDVNKYCITKNISITKIPITKQNDLNFLINVENANKYFKWLMNNLFDLKNIINYDDNIKNTITIKLLQLIRGN